MIGKKNILGVGITDATQKEVLEYLVKNIQNSGKKLFVITPNPEFLVLANKKVDFKNVLNKSDLASPDGVGIMMAAKFLGKPLKERFTGVDMVESLCKMVAEKPITVGFLGGRGGVAEKTSECLRKTYPDLKVAFVGEEWPGDDLNRQPRVSGDTWLSGRGPVRSNPSILRQGFGMVLPAKATCPSKLSKRSGVRNPSPLTVPNDQHFNNSTIQQFNNNNSIDILFVAFGAPKQEFWINENLDKIPVKVAIGVGGAFDYISNKIPRAPTLVRNIGLEWLFRLAVQPWRLKRQLSLLQFVVLVLKEKLN
jgi:N-acetylglucosaminyldiphosphoundecaprenol N-acetyl-beta-D-mannosaminyltransferase